MDDLFLMHQSYVYLTVALLLFLFWMCTNYHTLSTLNNVKGEIFCSNKWINHFFLGFVLFETNRNRKYMLFLNSRASVAPLDSPKRFCCLYVKNENHLLSLVTLPVTKAMSFSQWYHLK